MHPLLLQTDFFAIHTLWIFFGIAIIAATYALIKLSIKNSLKLQFLSENSGKMILISLIGARIVSLIENYDIYFYKLNTETFLQIFYIWDKGLNLWGAIIAFLIYLYYLCKNSEQDFWKWLDTVIPSIIIGLAIGHIGTFFEGINYGIETSLPWGVNFESPAIKYAVPIHPTQIYAFLYSTIIAVSLILLNQTEKIQNIKKAGFIGIVGILSYNFSTFLMEFLRGDDTLMILGIRVPQIITALIVIITGIFFYRRYNISDNSLIKKKWNL